MGKYTLSLQEIGQHYLMQNGYSRNDISRMPNRTQMELSRPFIFDFDYDIYDNDHKPELEMKVIRHYWLREIGVETIGMFKHYLEEHTLEYLPEYNALLKSTLLEFDILANTEFRQEYTKDGSNKTDDDILGKSRTGRALHDHKTGFAESKGTQAVAGEEHYVENNKGYTGQKDIENTHAVKDTSTDETLDKMVDGTNDTTTTFGGTTVLDRTGVDTNTKNKDFDSDKLHTGTIKTGDSYSGRSDTTDDIDTTSSKDFRSRNTFFDTPQDEITGTAFDAAGNQIMTQYTDSYGNVVTVPLSRDYATDLRVISETTTEKGTSHEVKGVIDAHSNDQTITYNDNVNDKGIENAVETLKKGTTDTTKHTGSDNVFATLGETTHQTTVGDEHEDGTIDRNLDRKIRTTERNSGDSNNLVDTDTHNISDTLQKQKQNETIRNVDAVTKAQTHDFSERYCTRKWGNNGGATFPALVMEFRKSIINVDQKFIYSLRDLFMYVM